STALIMPIAGRLLWRVGAAPIFAAGLAVFLPTLWGMSHWDAQSGFWDLFWPQVGRGVSMGLMFVPLSTSALRMLPPQDVLQAAALYTLSRRVGGSMGIAALATILDHRSVMHAAHLAERVTAFSDPTRLRLDSLTAGLAARGLDPVQAQAGALEILHGVVAREGIVLAFRDCFLGILCVFLLLPPFVVLLRGRRPRSRAWAPGAPRGRGARPAAPLRRPRARRCPAPPPPPRPATRSSARAPSAASSPRASAASRSSARSASSAGPRAGPTR